MGGQVPALLGIAVVAAAIVLAARIAVVRLEADPLIAARVKVGPLFALVLGAMALAAATGGGDPDTGLARVILAGLMAAAAWVDRQSAWVPDVLFLPVMALAGVVGAPFGDGLAGLVGGAFAGIATYAVCLALWQGLRSTGRNAIPPADLAALGLPLVLFGFDFRAGVAYAAASGLLIAARISPRLRDILSPRAPIEGALSDTGQQTSKTAEAVAFLPIMLASILAVLILEVQVPRPG
jgi:hypothetical protein